MKRKKQFTILFTIILSFNVLQPTIGAGQSATFSVDPKIPEIVLTDTTRLTVLNARHGSRFSLSISLQDKAFHSGSLGFDRDEILETLIGIRVNQKYYCFRTSACPQGWMYLKNQHIKTGLTAIQLSGETDEGVVVNLSIISPFTPSNALSDTANLKVQVMPAYYLLWDVSNTSSNELDVALFTGFKRFTIQKNNALASRSWAVGSKRNRIYFRDNTAWNTKTCLTKVSEQSCKQFSQQGFNGFEIPTSLKSKKSYSDTLLYATYFNGEVMHDNKLNQSLKFYYTNIWKNADDVIHYAKKHAASYITLSQKFENLLKRSGRTPEEKWIIAITFRSDLANSFLLIDEKQKPRFYLSEGRFRHLSTIDVAHETGITALFAPWRLKLQLDQWLDYMARKEVDRGISKYGDPHREGMSASEYGPYLYHDVGDMPNISETSDYWFGPHMAAEENANYPLLLYWYWKLTGDDAFVQSQLGMVDILLYSLMNRDTNGNGIADKGFGWTTYDASDVLKHSPDNLYLAVKQLCAYELAADMFENLLIKPDSKDNKHTHDKNAEDGTGVGFSETKICNEKLRLKQAKKYRQEAKKILSALQQAHKKHGYLPVSLDNNFKNRDAYSVVIGEGLLWTGLSGYSSKTINKLIPLIQSTYTTAFQKSTRSKAIALTTAVGSSWFSKIMVSDIIAGYWFNHNVSTAHFAFEINKNNYYAYNDGLKQDGKTLWTGFWYPRGVISLGYLLLEQKFTAQKRNEFLKDLQ